MATFRRGTSEELLRSLTSYLAFPSAEAASSLQKLLTQRRDVLLNPLSKKVRVFAFPECRILPFSSCALCAVSFRCPLRSCLLCFGMEILTL